MEERIRRHYLSTGIYTNPGTYAQYFRTLPDDIPVLGKIVCDQVVHPTILWFPSPNLETYFGPLSDYPFERVMNEDELFVTAPAMMAEIFRLDGRGFTENKKVNTRLAVSCRHAAVLMASICKVKGIPCRCRAGFIDFQHKGSKCGDHWINQIWNDTEKRWLTVDVDGYYEYEKRFGFSQFDMPSDKFYFAPQTWLGIRRGMLDANRFEYQDGKNTLGLKALIIYMFLDFHSLMNNELFYTFRPKYTYEKFDKLTEEDFEEVDQLAEYMVDPDANFDKLSKNHFRVLASPFNVFP